MKILLLGIYLPDNIQSIERFVSILQTGLPKFGHQVRIIRPQPWVGNINPSSTGIGKLLGYIDKFFVFPPKLRQEVSWADVVHICDHSGAVYIKFLQNIPHVVTCHDLLAIRSALGEIQQNQTRWTGKQLQRLILNGLNQAQQIVCVSEQTRQDLLRISSLKNSAISLIHMGLNYTYSPMELAKVKHRLSLLKISNNCRFILHVGQNVWYKNRLGGLIIFFYLTQKYRKTDLYLIMVSQPFTSEMRQLIEAYSLSQKVIELVQVSNEDLCALYSSATALLFPSLQEGFGWPIIEAQACGCPVFTSNRPPMTEVGGEAALYINPNNPETAAKKIASILPRLADFKEKSILNAQRFTTEKMLSSYSQVYRKVILENK